MMLPLAVEEAQVLSLVVLHNGNGNVGTSVPLVRRRSGNCCTSGTLAPTFDPLL
jgi:hypothetical protein